MVRLLSLMCCLFFAIHSFSDDELHAESLVISEIVAGNKSTYPTQIEGQEVIPDWIEIHNRGFQAVDLSGWYLTDDITHLSKWPLPEITLEAGGYWVVYACGIQAPDHPENTPFRDDLGRYHTNFELAGEGEFLALVTPAHTIAHAYTEHNGGYPPLREDLSYGLFEGRLLYLPVATPGQANPPGFAEIADDPVFRRPGGCFMREISLEFEEPAPGAQIRFTLDDTTPTETSVLYAEPFISIDETLTIQARTFEPGKLPSAVVSCTYIQLAGDIWGVTSNLPLVIIDTLRNSINESLYQRACSVFIDTPPGQRTTAHGPADYAGRCGMKIRGSSAARMIKLSYAFETRGVNDQDIDVSIFGMPSESDWVLYAPYQYDRALINNAFVYALSNNVGRYAVRTRFVEVYLNTDGGPISASDYAGLYIFMEKIKRGRERVDVEKLEPWDSTEPRVTGGYMFKIDRADPGDQGFRTSRGSLYRYVEPKEDEITPSQSLWLRDYLDEAEAALYGPQFSDPQQGYARYIDVNSFIDHHLINLLAANVDALRLSTYLFKTRGGKLEMGPVWDFDRSLDSTDSRDDNPELWRGSYNGTDFFNYGWWGRLFDDPDFWQRYIDRWWELRRSVFSEASLFQLIDSMAGEIDEAQERNYARWPGGASRFGDFAGEIAHLKDWLSLRLNWIDNQFGTPPVFIPEQGYIESLSGPIMHTTSDNGTIYYTVDGSDPRVFGPSTPPDVITLVPEESPKKVLVPTQPIGTAWRGGETSFDDSDWNTYIPVAGGTGGVGYDENDDYSPYISYDVEGWMNGDVSPNANTSCYIRIPFTITSQQHLEVNRLVLKVRQDDAYIAYLNGREVARSNTAPADPQWNSSVVSSGDSVSFEETTISSHIDALRLRKNILSIQGFNAGVNSSDFLISAVLEASNYPGGGVDTTSGDIAESAVEYTQPPILDDTHCLKARVLQPENPYSRWSGLTEAMFTVHPLPAYLRITELMYNPPEPTISLGEIPADNEDFEFIELMNVGDIALDLTGVSFVQGITFDFQSSAITTLEPNETVLLVKDQSAFVSRYGGDVASRIAGQYSGRLNNAGEVLQLEDIQQGTIAMIDYEDTWEPETDGSGYSLILIHPRFFDPSSWNSGDAWRSSVTFGGSPGWGDSAD